LSIKLFDKHNVSFVSVTQQFNTTTSMGRLKRARRDRSFPDGAANGVTQSLMTQRLRIVYGCFLRGHLCPWQQRRLFVGGSNK
jgi:hypothetical protein